MEKLVNVYTRQVIRSVKGVPIRSTVRSIMLDTEDIKQCILAKASVEEVLDDGSTLPLNFVNYNKDNNAKFRTNAAAPAVETPAPAPVVEQPAPTNNNGKKNKKNRPETVKLNEQPAPVEEVKAEEPAAEETAVEETAVEEAPAAEEEKKED